MQIPKDRICSSAEWYSIIGLIVSTELEYIDLFNIPHFYRQITKWTSNAIDCDYNNDCMNERMCKITSYRQDNLTLHFEI